MIKYVLFRFFFMFVTLFLVIMAIYIMTAFGLLKYTDLTFAEKMQHLFSLFYDYIKGIIFEWDWGEDRFRRDVFEESKRIAFITLRLNILAFLFYTGTGVLLGTLAAVYKDSLLDRGIQFFVLVFNSIPPYIMVMLLILFFGYYLEWLPPQNPMSTRGFLYRMSGFVIPVVAIASLPVARFARLIRAEMLEAFYSDYLLLLKTKGLNRWQMIKRHILKDCSVALMPELLPMVIYALVSSFIIELIYNIPGLTRYMFKSIFSPVGTSFYVDIDLHPVVMVGAIFTAFTLFAALLIDVSYALIDPRMRVGQKKP